jgi:D-arabinose 1-dehydrogenase-like Zn-dependent alcohol dehydrogenase
MITRRLSLVGWSAGTAQDTEDCLKFALTHEIHAPVEKFSLDQCNDAWNKMIDPATMDKPVLMMQ